MRMLHCFWRNGEMDCPLATMLVTITVVISYFNFNVACVGCFALSLRGGRNGAVYF